MQSQTSGGESGLFGKTWVEVSGRRMRLVSGSARKVGADGRQGEPLRLIQIVDLDKGSTTLLNPKTKSYESLPLGEIRYAGALEGRAAPPEPAALPGILGVADAGLGPPGAPAPRYHVRSMRIEVERGRLDRDMGDTSWPHYRIGVRLDLAGDKGADAAARMEHDLWLAPLAGDLQEGLLDLVAFENAFRKAAGSPFAPLDFWTCQMREVAAYLDVPESEVREVLRQVREAFPAVPGYPLANSISWWREEVPPDASQAKSEPRLRPARPIETARFRPIDFGGSWRLIDQMLGTGPAPAPAAPPARRRFLKYNNFQAEVRRSADEAGPGAQGAGARDSSGPTESPAPAGAPPSSPFFQIHTELDAFTFVEEIPAEDFIPPPGYKPAPRKKKRL